MHLLPCKASLLWSFLSFRFPFLSPFHFPQLKLLLRWQLHLIESHSQSSFLKFWAKWAGANNHASKKKQSKIKWNINNDFSKAFLPPETDGCFSISPSHMEKKGTSASPATAFASVKTTTKKMGGTKMDQDDLLTYKTGLTQINWPQTVYGDFWGKPLSVAFAWSGFKNRSDPIARSFQDKLVLTSKLFGLDAYVMHMFMPSLDDSWGSFSGRKGVYPKKKSRDNWIGSAEEDRASKNPSWKWNSIFLNLGLLDRWASRNCGPKVTKSKNQTFKNHCFQYQVGKWSQSRSLFVILPPPLTTKKRTTPLKFNMEPENQPLFQRRFRLWTIENPSFSSCSMFNFGRVHMDIIGYPVSVPSPSLT